MTHVLEAWRAAARAPRETRERSGFDAAAHALAGVGVRLRSSRRSLLARAARVEARARQLADESDAALAAQRTGLERALRRTRPDRGTVDEALAHATDMARRQLDLQPHRVQIAGALAVVEGAIAEMATGEGKTLTAALAAVPLAWARRGCHVVTANDYLATRDATAMRGFFDRLRLRVAALTSSDEEIARRHAYAADVTYTTGRELAGDHLRDTLALGHRTVASDALRRILGVDGRLPLQRGLHAAIVDEADFVLIDEAVTPLILSGPVEGGAVLPIQAARATAAGLERAVHFDLDADRRTATLTPAGRAAVLESGVLPETLLPRERLELVSLALAAEHCLERGRDYLVDDAGHVVIVDQATGRPVPERRWRAGLHEAVEEKEGRPAGPPTDTKAQISFQRFFRRYAHLGGMTGTAREAAREFWSTYDVRVVSIPTHRPIRRRRERLRVFLDDAARDAFVVDAVRAESHAGRAVLVGCASVSQSEAIGDRCATAGIDARILNAERHADEAEVIAGAGAAGQVTIATSMAGRGTDIVLSDSVRASGGLVVVTTFLGPTARVDRQLHGRSGRQGDPGRVVRCASLEGPLADLMPRSVGLLRRVRLPERLLDIAGAFVLARAQAASEARARRQRGRVRTEDAGRDDALAFRAPG